MAISLNINGQTYSFPEQGDDPSWGNDVANWASAISNGVLQKAGGTFTLTSEVDFGSNFGIKLPYIKSSSSNIADAGFLRLANTDSLAFRNNANDDNLLLDLDGDNLQFNSDTIALLTATQTFTNKTLTNPTISGLTASRALETDGSGNLQESAITSTELNHLDGVSLNIQDQLDDKVTNPMTNNDDLIVQRGGVPTRLPVGSDGEVLGVVAGELTYTTSGNGDVIGPASSTDNELPRYDGTGGKNLQGSGVIVDDSQNVAGVNNLEISGAITATSGGNLPGQFKQTVEIKVSDLTDGAFVYTPSAGVKTIKVTGVAGGGGGGGSPSTAGTQVGVGSGGSGGGGFIKTYNVDELTPDAVTVDSATNIDNSTDTFTSTAHGMESGREVQVTTSNTLPTGLSLATSYYIIRIDADNFQLASTRANAMAGTQIDITSDGVGNQTVTSHGSTHAIAVVGAGGSGGSGSTGNDGDATSFKLCEGNGGEAGFSAGATVGGRSLRGRSGGSVSGGDFNFPGGASYSGLIKADTNFPSTGGNGGSSLLGAGGRGFATVANGTGEPGLNGEGFGSGGSGALGCFSTSIQSGGDGADGVIIIEEYY